MPRLLIRRGLVTGGLWLCAAGIVGGLLQGCASSAPQAKSASPAEVEALAPSGRLRASINLGNPVLASRDATTGALKGVSVDLANELGRQLGVPVELVAVQSAGRSVEVVSAAEADVGFFAIDPLRGKGIGFTSAYVVIEGAYLVRADSPLQSNAEVDRAGTTIAVGKGSAYDLFLSRDLKHATLVRAATSPQVVDEFLARKLDVAAGVRQQLDADSRRVPGLRMLPGRFMVIEQAMGVPGSRSSLAQATLKRFVEEMKRSGFVADSLRRHGIEGAAVASPA